jgi:PAS domain S-box-containing protein
MSSNIITLSRSAELINTIEGVLSNSNGDYSLFEAKTLERLESILTNQQPDLILLDSEFIDDALDILGYIKNNSKTLGISIILLSREFDFDKLKSLFNFGIEDYATLPFSDSEFLLRVEMGIARGKWMAKLLLQSQHFSDITQAASLAGSSLVIINGEGEIVWVNEGFERLYGCNLKDFEKTFGTNLFESATNPATQHAMKRCRENGEYVVYDSLWITPNRERKYIQTSLTPIYDGEGNFSKIIAIETDITDLKAAEEALIEKNDNLLTIMEHLEKANEMLDEQRTQIEIQKASLEEEMKKSETLLLAILPDTTAHQLKKKGFVKPKKFKEASVMFIDFVGFSRISSYYNEIEDLLEVLNFYFEKFDEITSQHFIEKIKTIGDCYMCVGGVPHSNKSNPYDSVIAALKIQKMVDEFAKRDQAAGKPVWRVRIGIHTGPLVGGIIGKKRFAYDIWGDTVNLASRMESSGETGKVNISDATHSYIKNYISCNYRGKVPAKNLGEINMYFVERIKPEFSEDSEGYIPNAEFRKIIAAV